MALPPSDGVRASTRLKQLIHRKGQVLSVMHPPTAALARIMERAGCEALFVGTSAVVGGYTGIDDRVCADRRLDRQQRCHARYHRRRYRPRWHHGGTPAGA